MSEETPGPVSLISQWFIRPGFEAQVIEGVTQLAADIEANEPGTLTYLVHTPRVDDDVLQSLPPSNPLSLLFFETYRDPSAFVAHVKGPLFTQFVQQFGNCFVPSDPLPTDPGSTAGPYSTVQFLTQQAGFALGQPPGGDR
jgi:quinol monooxygenase YgiN